MKIWATEHVFGHSWDTVVKGQWQKYPNPHNPAVLGTDVLERRVDPDTGILHSERIIQSDWGLAPWVQKLIGANRTCYAREVSTVDPTSRVMEMRSVNLTFCNFVSMHEHMSYRPHPKDPERRTLLKQETVVKVQGVPLTSYMESIIMNTVSANAAKGRAAIDWIVNRLGTETKNLSASLDLLRTEISEVASSVEDKIVRAARASIDELQRDLRKIQPPILVVLNAESAENLANPTASRHTSRRETSL